MKNHGDATRSWEHRDVFFLAPERFAAVDRDRRSYVAIVPRTVFASSSSDPPSSRRPWRPRWNPAVQSRNTFRCQPFIRKFETTQRGKNIMVLWNELTWHSAWLNLLERFDIDSIETTSRYRVGSLLRRTALLTAVAQATRSPRGDGGWWLKKKPRVRCRPHLTLLPRMYVYHGEERFPSRVEKSNPMFCNMCGEVRRVMCAVKRRRAQKETEDGYDMPSGLLDEPVWCCERVLLK